MYFTISWKGQNPHGIWYERISFLGLFEGEKYLGPTLKRNNLSLQTSIEEKYKVQVRMQDDCYLQAILHEIWPPQVFKGKLICKSNSMGNAYFKRQSRECWSTFGGKIPSNAFERGNITLNRLLKENVIYRPGGRITAIYKQYCMGDRFHLFFTKF